MNSTSESFFSKGTIYSNKPTLVGIFDGMGGEECGEIASLIAAKCAAETVIENNSIDSLVNYCKNANERICEYAKKNSIWSMGTTAALLAFANTEISLCNIGDSKIFQFIDGKFEQISMDHNISVAPGLKPQLSQNLGIPTSEMIIEPYIAHGEYNDGDVYLICSDGLTDMVTIDEIIDVLKETRFEESVNKLLELALLKGGKDNITIILCKVLRERRSSKIIERAHEYINKRKMVKGD